MSVATRFLKARHARPAEALTRLEWTLLSIIACVFVTQALFKFLFLRAIADIDSLGLFNPVYMFLHYGKATYPVYYHFNEMIVHPPVRYVEIALLMRLGLPLTYAQGLMVFLLTVACIASIVFSPFGFRTRFGLLFGLFCAMLFMTEMDPRMYGIRPDTQLALAWFLGLVTLERSRRLDWHPVWAFVGAFFLTYAAGLHYYGVAAVFGVGIYLIAARASMPASQFYRVGIAACVGASLFGIPYLVMFVGPHLRSILTFSHQVQAVGAWYTPMVRHFEQYTWWRLHGSPTQGMHAYQLLLPVLYTRVPLFVVGAALLGFARETRLMAVLAMPLCLFVFGYSQGKSAGYFLPEVILCFAGLGVGLFVCIQFLASKLPAPLATLLPAGGLCLLTLVVARAANPGITNIPIRFSQPVNEMELARAAGKAMVGDNALGAGRIGMWYVSGASDWYSLESNLLWRRDISAYPLAQYFRNFDFVAEYGPDSYVTINSRLQSLPSWYQDGLLKLRGFYLSTSSPDINYLLFQALPPERIAGFVSEPDRLYRFDVSPSGDQVFSTAVCPMETNVAVDPIGYSHFTAMYLPMPDANDRSKSLSIDAGPSHPRPVLIAGIMPYDRFQAPRHTTSCTFLQDVRGNLSLVDREPLIRNMKAHDRTIKFYETVEDIGEERDRALTRFLRKLPLDELRASSADTSISKEVPTLITTPAAQWAFSAYLPLPAINPDCKGGIKITARVTKGTAGFGVLDLNHTNYLIRKFVVAADTTTNIWLPMKNFDAGDWLMIENGTPDGARARVSIEDVSIFLAPCEASIHAAPGGR
jgi:hypothetical protein